MNLSDRKDGEKVLVLGHRGSPTKEIENTLASFHQAIKDGADGVELDVRPTTDHRLVVSHDNNLRRVYGVEKKIEELSYPELQEIAPTIPLLSEVLDDLGQVYFDIEIKADKPLGFNPDVVTLLEAELAKRPEMKDRIMISSFNPFALRLFGKANSLGLPMGLIYEGDSPKFKHLTNHGQGRLAFHCSFLKPKYDIAPQEKRRHKGYAMVPWTVDTKEDLEKVLEAKCPMVITNRPDDIIRMLREDGLR